MDNLKKQLKNYHPKPISPELEMYDDFALYTITLNFMKDNYGFLIF